MTTAVSAAGRTLDIFELFGLAREPLSLTELAKRISVPTSSCHAIVRTLQQRGYLYSVSRRKEIYPTKRLLDLAQAIVAHDPFLERIAPLLLRLRDETGETVIFGKRQRDAVLYLEVIEGAHTVRYTARPGEYKPLHSSAIGKAVLAQLDAAALQTWLAAQRLPAVTPNTITKPQRLRADLQAGRKRGYFVTRGENVADVMAVAAGISINGDAFGIAVAGPLQRMSAELDRHAQALAKTRRAIVAGQS